MIVKNHDIELKDTSASEMARFRQIMLSIWRQQIEDDKNDTEMLKYANALKSAGTAVSPLTSILQWIKKNIDNKNKALKLSSLPKNAFQDLLSETLKGHFIKCYRYLFETIVDLKNIKFEVSFRPVETVFLLSIFNPQKNLVFRFESKTYEGLEYLAKFISYDIATVKKTITQQYRKEIAAAGNDKNKLDIIYEVIPDFILRTLKTNQQMYADIWTLLDQDFSDNLGRDEDKGILNILKTLQKKDAKKLYEKLYERPLWVMKLYKTFAGDDRRNFVALVMDLCRYSTKKPEKNQKIYLPDGYWLSNVQLNVNWNSYMIDIESSSTLLTNFGNLMVSSSTVTRSKEPFGLKTLYKGGLLNPMDLITVKSVIGMNKDGKITTEAASNQVALFIKYKVDELSEEIFWNVINVASTLAGGYGAVRVLTLEGAGWLIKTAAILELSKATLDLVMLNDNAKKALKDAGLGILVDNWTTISITADLTFLSLDGLFALAKYGNKGAKVLKEANQLEEAAHLEKQTEKAFKEIETQTGVDVSKMSEKEINETQKILHELGERHARLETKLAKIASKTEDVTGNFPEVKDIEDKIRILDKEHGMFFDIDGKKLLKEPFGEHHGSIDIQHKLSEAIKENRARGGRFNDLTFTHNHYLNSALSPSDIMQAILNNLKEIRAIGRSGIDYSLERIRHYPPKEDILKMFKKANNKMKSKYPALHPTKYINGGGNIEMAQFYAETLLEQFEGYIKYTKFTK